jgi:DNA (cytosine-5)-methyltransferase 1
MKIKKTDTKSLKFIDLFAGIGGTRLGYQLAGAECVFSSEWDKFSQQTYYNNFGEVPAGDINKIKSSDIPNFDILLAGFPCQPFSIAGVSKKTSLGKPHGFKDEKQGNLFFELARVIGDKKPAVFMLENVKNLKSHDKGRTFGVINDTLTALNYKIFTKIIDARYFVPQHRERIYIIGFRKDLIPDDFEFIFPEIPTKEIKLETILEKKGTEKYTLSDKLWSYLQSYAKKHKLQGNGFGFGMADPKGVTRTLSARYHKDGSEILIPQKGKNPRRLTPRECARLMGFPDSYKITVSDTQAYRQFGNSVVVPVINSIATEVLASLNKLYATSDNRSKVKEHVGHPVKV